MDTSTPVQTSPSVVETLRKAVMSLVEVADEETLRRNLAVYTNGASTTQPVTNGRTEPTAPLAQAPAKKGKLRGPYKKDPHSLHSLHRHVLTTVPMPLGASIEMITSTLNKSGRMPTDWNQDDSTKILTRSPHVFQRLHNGNWILKKIASKHLPLIDPIK